MQRRKCPKTYKECVLTERQTGHKGRVTIKKHQELTNSNIILFVNGIHDGAVSQISIYQQPIQNGGKLGRRQGLITSPLINYRKI
jgi:hypothetical protein